MSRPAAAPNSAQAKPEPRYKAIRICRHCKCEASAILHWIAYDVHGRCSSYPSNASASLHWTAIDVCGRCSPYPFNACFYCEAKPPSCVEAAHRAGWTNTGACPACAPNEWFYCGFGIRRQGSPSHAK